MYTVSDIPPGTVLRLYVTDTRPPKTKRFVVIGFNESELQLAVVYINTIVNKRFAWSIELECLHLKLEANGRSYLDYDSWIDCSDLIIKDTNDILNSISTRPEAIIGQMSYEDFSDVLKLLQTSPKIKGKIKKRFGIFEP